jgi:hypothetical protein
MQSESISIQKECPNGLCQFFSFDQSSGTNQTVTTSQQGNIHQTYTATSNQTHESITPEETERRVMSEQFDKAVAEVIKDIRMISDLKSQINAIGSDCSGCDTIKKKHLAKMIAKVEDKISKANRRVRRVARRATGT